MSEATELTLEDLHNMTSEDVAAAAAAEDRIPSGNYLAKVSAVFAKRHAEDSEWNAGRSVADLALDLHDVNDPTVRVGKVFLKVSWEPRYNAGGKLDNPSRRYSELEKSLGVKERNPGAVLDAAKQVMFMVKIRETMKVAESDIHESQTNARTGADGEAWVAIASDEVFDYYTALGYESRSMVDRVFKAR